jgi:hypothetical protein
VRRQFRLADGFDHGDAQRGGTAGPQQGLAVWLAGHVIDNDAQPHPAIPDVDRPVTLETIADCAASIRQAAHRQSAAESSDAELAHYTYDAAMTVCDVHALPDKAVLTATLRTG